MPNKYEIVSRPYTKQGRENWDRIFEKKYPITFNLPPLKVDHQWKQMIQAKITGIRVDKDNP